MKYLITKKEFDSLLPGYKELYELSDIDIDMVDNLVDFCIDSLYRPDKERVYVADREKLEKWGIDGESINWGDLHCVKVEKKGGRKMPEKYTVYIEEASEYCPNFASYIEEMLFDWGWDVEVKTEW